MAGDGLDNTQRLVARLEQLERRQKDNATEVQRLQAQVLRLEHRNEQLQKTVALLQSQQATTARKRDKGSTPAVKHSVPSDEKAGDPGVLQKLTHHAESPQEREPAQSCKCTAPQSDDCTTVHGPKTEKFRQRRVPMARTSLHLSWTHVVELLQGKAGPDLMSHVGGVRPRFVEKLTYGRWRTCAHPELIRSAIAPQCGQLTACVS